MAVFNAYDYDVMPQSRKYWTALVIVDKNFVYNHKNMLTMVEEIDVRTLWHVIISAAISQPMAPPPTTTISDDALICQNRQRRSESAAVRL